MGEAFETIKVEVGGDGIATVTFDRAETRNALNLTMVREVRRALEELSLRDDVRVLIFTGAGGKAFVSGADIAELRERGRMDALRRINSDLFRLIERFPQPTIAAIQGVALGGGCELAIACDLRVAGEGAKLGQPEVGLGILPGAGATYRLPRLIGLGAARELVFTGRIVDAKEALALGLVNRVVPDDLVLASARALALEIARNGALAVRLAKASLNLGQEISTDAGQALESTAQAVLFEDDDKRARMTAFLEKRGKKSEPKAGAALVVRAAGEPGRRLELADLRALPGQVDDVGSVIPGRKGAAVALSSILHAVGMDARMTHVGATSSDGNFQASLSLDEALRALVVHSLAGGPLPDDQGGPFRLLVPGGADPCANLKQLATLELRTEAGTNTCPHGPEEHARMRAGHVKR